MIQVNAQQFKNELEQVLGLSPNELANFYPNPRLVKNLLNGFQGDDLTQFRDELNLTNISNDEFKTALPNLIDNIYNIQSTWSQDLPNTNITDIPSTGGGGNGSPAQAVAEGALVMTSGFPSKPITEKTISPGIT